MEETKHDKMKYRLADAMKNCMKKMPVEKITVKEIVTECGTTRQTFYRNFQDKYDLINWYFDKILLESFEHMGEGRTVYESLVNKFEYIQVFSLLNKAAEMIADGATCVRRHFYEPADGPTITTEQQAEEQAEVQVQQEKPEKQEGYRWNRKIAGIGAGAGLLAGLCFGACLCRIHILRERKRKTARARIARQRIIWEKEAEIGYQEEKNREIAENRKKLI